ncbi:MAG: acyltransferase domain-containing protein [Bacillota bacterium]|nr:acyltransferase domain-containing protein [Bacillota bacterium]
MSADNKCKNACPYESLRQLVDDLAVQSCPPRWTTLFDQVMAKYADTGCPPADDKALCRINEQYNLFDASWKTVLHGARLIRGNKPLACYLLLLQEAMVDRASFYSEINEIEMPEAPSSSDSLGYDLLPLYLLPHTVPATVADWQAHHIPRDIMQRSLKSYELSLMLHQRRQGKVGYSLHDLRWNLGFADGRLLRIGRFNIEIKPSFAGRIQVFRHNDNQIQTLVDNLKLHKSGFAHGSPGYTDESGSFTACVSEKAEAWQGYPVLPDGRAAATEIKLPKNEWQLVLRWGDPVLSVHIPPDESLAPAICEQSYREADVLIRTCYPDYQAKAFVCHSWLMDPQLSILLKPESNIVAFQQKYTVFPAPSSGKAIFRFVFEKQYDRLEDLPETTSLERALKQHYLAGKYIYEPGGFFFMPVNK